MKRINLAVVVSVLLLSLAGCTNPALDEDTDIVNTESVLSEQNVAESDEVSEMETTEETTQPAEEEEVVDNKADIPNAYNIILNNIYDALQLNPLTDEINSVHFSTGIWEVVSSIDTAEDRMKAVAYCILDVNEDGVDELLIVDSGYGENERILDMYTLVEGTSVRVIEGWARNRYYLLNDGMIYCSGSGGAAYSNEELLSLDPETYELTPKEIYFTYPKDDDMSQCEYYYNADGVYDVSAATKISVEEFQSFYTECESRIVTIDVKIFDSINKK